MKMKKIISLYVWLFSLMIPSIWAQETVDVVRAFTNRKAIVIEYDLAEDADLVRLFVSLDGGATYRGPMQLVSGDIVDVKAGFGRCIVWDVLKELDVKAFDSDQVRFKLNILLKERWPRETFRRGGWLGEGTLGGLGPGRRPAVGRTEPVPSPYPAGSSRGEGLSLHPAHLQDGGAGPAPRRPPGVLWTASGHVRPHQLPAG